jgi:hypothetical protein
MTTIRTIFAALLVSLCFASPTYATTIASSPGLPSGHKIYTEVRSSTTGSSHYVHPYCRKNGVCVRGHMTGNPGSGEHWHLNKDGSDTVTHPNGTRQTIPGVAPSK